MRRPAGAAPTEAERCAPAQAQVLGAAAPESPWQALGEPLNKSGAVVVPHNAASLPQEVPTASLPEGCAQRYAPQAEHHVDPFGMLGLVDLWPANSTARVRPRPFPVGPAYNSSEFDLFTNITVVALVSLRFARNTLYQRARTSCVSVLAERVGAHCAGRLALSSDRRESGGLAHNPCVGMLVMALWPAVCGICDSVQEGRKVPLQALHALQCLTRACKRLAECRRCLFDKEQDEQERVVWNRCTMILLLLTLG